MRGKRCSSERTRRWSRNHPQYREKHKQRTEQPKKLQQLQKQAINPQIPTRRVSSRSQFWSQLLSRPSAGIRLHLHLGLFKPAKPTEFIFTAAKYLPKSFWQPISKNKSSLFHKEIKHATLVLTQPFLLPLSQKTFQSEKSVRQML